MTFVSTLARAVFGTKALTRGDAGLGNRYGKGRYFEAGTSCYISPLEAIFRLDQGEK